MEDSLLTGKSPLVSPGPDKTVEIGKPGSVIHLGFNEAAAPKKTSPQARARAKGKRIEKRHQEFLESIGFRVQPAHQQVRHIGPGIDLISKKFNPNRIISKQADFYECLDKIALHPAVPYTLCIQDTVEGKVTERKKKIEACTHWNLAVQRVQIWAKDDSTQNRVIVHQRTPEGWEELSFRMVNGEWPNGILGPYPGGLL